MRVIEKQKEWLRRSKQAPTQAKALYWARRARPETREPKVLFHSLSRVLVRTVALSKTAVFRYTPATALRVGPRTVLQQRYEAVVHPAYDLRDHI